jgi:hypothetical protein
MASPGSLRSDSHTASSGGSSRVYSHTSLISEDEQYVSFLDL